MNKDMNRNNSKNSAGMESLLEESRRLLAESGSKDLSISKLPANISPDIEEIYENLTSAFENNHQRTHFELAKLNLVLEASKIGLWEMQVVKGDPVNPANTFMWSDEFRYMLGYSNEIDFPNLLSSWSDKLHPEDKGRVLDCFARHLLDRSGRTPYDLEYRLLKKNNEYSYFHAFGATLRDEQGYAIKVAGALKDISELKKAELERETAALRLNLLQKSINVALWDMEVDPKDPVGGSNEFWWSPEFRNMLGFSGERDFPNVLSSWSERLHPEDKEKTLKAFAAHLVDRTGNTPYNILYRVKRKSGEYVWLKADGSTLRDKDGKPLRVVGSVEDVSLRESQKEQLEGHIVEFSRRIESMTRQIEAIVATTASIADAQRTNLRFSTESEKNATETQSIISAIQTIAYQTGILGINASIEASRAGQSGRGFAVVAEEVRKLAQDSKNSSSQIELKLKSIQDSAKQIAAAIQSTDELVNEQNSTMAKLKENLTNVTATYTEMVNMIKSSVTSV